MLAYVLWGFFPLYWALLKASTATEVLAHRVAGTFVFLTFLVVATRRAPLLRALTRRQWGLLAVASALITANWLLYIWAVQHAHVVETSLGYFINPLATVALGVGVLGERLRRAQAIAISVATLAVLGFALELGRTPWIALALAGSFSAYGLIKKQTAAPPLVSVLVETAFVALPAVGWLAWLHAQGTDTLFRLSATHDALLLGAGVVTAVPLLAFAGAANRVPLTVLGPLQYLSPTLQFLCGVLVLGERVSAGRWAAFALVWLALVVFTWDSVTRARDERRRLARAGA